MPILLGVVVAVCCGAPLLVASLLATGVGATLAAAGWPALGISVVAIGIAALLRRILGARRACEPANGTTAAAKDSR